MPIESNIAVNDTRQLLDSMINPSIRFAENSDEDRWDQYVSWHKDSLAYHQFAWKKAIEKGYGVTCPYVIAENEHRICGVLPVAHVHFPFVKGSLVSLPYCDVGGILADSAEIAKALFSYISQYAHERRINEIEVRYSYGLSRPQEESDTNHEDKVFHCDSEASASGKVRMLLELPDNSESLLASFKSKLRSQILKPARDGLTAEIGGPELLEAFYSVFAENMRALGSPPHSIKWLANILNQYGLKAKCAVVYMPDRTPAAGGIILCHHNIVSIPWASSLSRFNRFNPNMLLYWSFLKFAADKGYGYFDFGRSTPGEGTYKFKAQWGAVPRALRWERWNPRRNRLVSDSAESASIANSRCRALAEKIIKHTPLPVTIFIGRRIRKYIPL